MTDQPAKSNGERRSSDPPLVENSLDELRRLLIGPEKQQLVVIRERLENPKLRAQDVSGVLVEAIRIQQESKAQELDGALISTVESGLKTSVRRDPQTLANALYPVMGPAIRRSIYESIRALIESFNQALSRGLSIRGLRWRIEAMRTGRPFAEVVLLHTLVFRVEQIFLIHKRTGLLLQHLAGTGVGIQDPEMISGMLSAIQEFVRDSFRASQTDSLNAMQVGDLQVWVEQGPEAILAAVVRGHAPQRLHFKLKGQLERLHQEFGETLDAFEGDASPFQSASSLLSDCLESQFGDEAKPPTRPFAAVAIAVLVLLCVTWGVTALIRHRRWADLVGRLDHEPGLVVLTSEEDGGRYQVSGLRDPLASDPMDLLKAEGLSSERIDFQWKPYASLDPAITLRRARNVLHPPREVKLSLEEGALHLIGEAPEAWIENARHRAPLISGVTSLNLKGLVSSEQAELDRSREAVESVLIVFPLGKSSITRDQQAAIETVSQDIQTLLGEARQLDEPLVVELTGRADRSGMDSGNRLLSQERARVVFRALQRRGIDRKDLRWKAIGSTHPLSDESDEPGRQKNRSVSFKAVPSRSQNH